MVYLDFFDKLLHCTADCLFIMQCLASGYNFHVETGGRPDSKAPMLTCVTKRDRSDRRQAIVCLIGKTATADDAIET